MNVDICVNIKVCKQNRKDIGFKTCKISNYIRSPLSRLLQQKGGFS